MKTTTPDSLEATTNAKRARRIATARNSGRMGLFFGITAAFVSSLCINAFARLPMGMTMRPAAVYLLLLVCFATSVLGVLPLSIKCLVLGFRDRTACWIGFVGFILSVSGASGIFLFRVIAAARHYVLEP